MARRNWAGSADTERRSGCGRGYCGGYERSELAKGGLSVHGRFGFGGGDRGRGSNPPGSGAGGNCICPSCGQKEPHVAGQRCRDIPCPKCGTRMIRE